MKRPTQEEELKIYRDLLIKLHTTRRTGNSEQLNVILNRIGEYSFVRTNSVEDYKQKERDEIQTLLNLSL